MGHPRILLSAVLLSACLLWTGPLLAPVGAEGVTSGEAVETVSVTLGPLGAVIEGKGRLAPVRSEGVACEPDLYSGPFKVAETAKEGLVVKGQVLVRFEEEDYDKQLADRERGLAGAHNGLERQEHDFQLAEREAAVAMDEVIRKKRFADESMERFLKFEQKTKLEEARLRLQGSRDRIKDQQEELDQLEKMYSEDDLTEETEEIVLSRARRSLERALTYFSNQKNRHDYHINVVLPREHETLRLKLRKAKNAMDRLQATQPLDMAKRQMDLDKTRREYKEKEAELEKFRLDRAALTLKAPFAGYATAGSFSASKWSGLGSLETTLVVGKTVKAKQVLFTVVDDGALLVRMSVKESDLLSIAPGGPATFTCGLTGKDVFEAVIQEIARYGADGKHALTLRLKSKDKRLRAGLACAVSLPKADNKDVLSIPTASVLEQKGKHFVFLRNEDGVITKTAIEVGQKAAGRFEIESGLKAGQRILKAPPEENATAAKKIDTEK